VVDLVKELKNFGTQVDIYDPQADEKEVSHEYGLSTIKSVSKKYHAIVLAVSHREFATLSLESLKEPNAVVYDIKGFLDKSQITARL
jgi:UDP-N-acetyl-D-galactosamine dehydrogenase